MRAITLIPILVFGLACGQRNRDVESNISEPEIPPAYTTVDNRKGEQFIAVIQESGNSISISDNELKAIDKLLRQRIEEHNKRRRKDYFINLNSYKRQYFPVVNSNGEKEIEINCFCQVHNNDNWKQYRVLVKDGGICYFNLKVNLTKASVSDLYVNGEA